MGKSFTTPGAKLTDLHQSSADRLMDAKILFEGSRYASAVAMGLYALEIALKARICQKLELDALPKAFEVHDLEALLLLAGLSQRLTASGSIGVKANWDKLSKYMIQYCNELRYKPSDLTETQAKEILDWLQIDPDGVLPWLSAQT